MVDCRRPTSTKTRIETFSYRIQDDILVGRRPTSTKTRIETIQQFQHRVQYRRTVELRQVIIDILNV